MPTSGAECSNWTKLSDGNPVEKRATVRLRHGSFKRIFKVIHLHLVLVFTSSEVTCAAG